MSFWGLGLMVAVHTLNDGMMMIVIPFLPVLAGVYHLNSVQTGMIVTVYTISAAMFGIPVSLYADLHHQRRLTLSLGLVASGLGVMIYGLAPSYAVLLLAAAVGGLGFSPFHPSSVALIADGVAQERRGLSLGIFNIGGSLGNAVVPLFAGLLATFLSWQYSLGVFGPVTIALGIVIFIIFREPAFDAGQAPTSPRKALGVLIKNARLLRVFVVTGMHGFAWKGVVVFMPLALAQLYGWNTAALAGGVFALNAAGIASQPMIGHLSDRIGRRSITLVGLAVAGTSAAIMPFIHPAWLLLAVMVLWGGVTLGLRPVYLGQITDVVERETHASGVGMNFFVNQATGAMATAVGGFIVLQWGYIVLFLVFALVFFATLYPAARAFQGHHLRVGEPPVSA